MRREWRGQKKLGQMEKRENWIDVNWENEGEKERQKKWKRKKEIKEKKKKKGDKRKKRD